MNDANAKFSAIGRGKTRQAAYDEAIQRAAEYFEVPEEELFVTEEVGRRHEEWLEGDPGDPQEGWYYSASLICRIRLIKPSQSVRVSLT